MRKTLGCIKHYSKALLKNWGKSKEPNAQHRVENEKGDVSKFKKSHKVGYLNPELLLKYLSELNFKVELTEG